MTPALTQSQVFTALRTYLLAIAPAGTEVVQGQGNRVPMPGADSTIVMTEIQRKQLASTLHDYAPPTDPVPAIGSETVTRSMALTILLDVFGATSADTAQVITTLLRDAHGWAALKGSGIEPLYCEDPLQLPFIGGEQQFIQRWTVRAVLQANMAVTVDQQFADTLITTLTEFH